MGAAATVTAGSQISKWTYAYNEITCRVTVSYDSFVTDTLGRQVSVALNLNSNDLLGRVATVSNPHRSGSLPTDGTTSYQYDPLSRKTLEIPPDGTTTSNNVQTAYGGQTTGAIGLTTTLIDQAGHKRMSVTDALGRMVDVWEPDPVTGTLINETLYTYNARDNLTRVDEKGNTTDSTQWRTRTFTYDSLSRLLTASNPESGTITWTYDPDSNVLTKKDAKNVTITYNYDQLHRVATVGSTHAKSYSNGDPVVDYYFDQTSFNMTIAEGVNHRTGMADRTGSAAWTFDTEGRALSEKRTINISGLTPSAVTIGEKVADTLNKAPLPSDRGSQGLKGSGQLLLGGATIASVATGEPGPFLAVTGILTGASLSVRGTTNIVGAATNTDVSHADKVLAATANPAGLVATAATGGNLTAGRVAATAQSVGMAVTGAVQNPQSLASPATIAKNTNLVVNIGQLGAQLSGSTANLLKPTPPPPPPPKPPSAPTCALSKEGCH